MKLAQLNKPHGLSGVMLCIPLDCFAAILFGHKLTTKFKAKKPRPEKTSRKALKWMKLALDPMV